MSVSAFKPTLYYRVNARQILKKAGSLVIIQQDLKKIQPYMKEFMCYICSSNWQLDIDLSAKASTEKTRGRVKYTFSYA